MLTIKLINEIIEELLLNKQAVRNFPKSVYFPFDKLYMDLVTQLKTSEISSECILFDSVESLNETKAFSDPGYWTQNYPKESIDKFWVFGQNGQGDLWLFDHENKIYFYDHNKEEMCEDNFIKFNLNFEKWLQFADLNKQLDYIYDTENEISNTHKIEYREALNNINSTLLENYPFDI